MPNWRATLILAFASVTTLGAMLLARSPKSVLGHAELSMRDCIARNGRSAPANPKLIFLAIDSSSISLDATADLESLFELDEATPSEKQALSLISAQWPWPRSVYALVLDRLCAAGAKAVVFDLHFPTSSEDDALFRQTLDRYADRVVIGSNFTTSLRDDRGVLDASLALPTKELIPQDGNPDQRVGYVNFWPDEDGAIRQTRFQTNFAQFLGAEGDFGETNYSSLAAQAVRKFGHPELVPGDNESRHFRYTGAPGKGYPARSLFEIFVPDYWKRNFRSGKVFDGALVVIGAAGNWQHDEHPTPFGVMSGPEIQLNAMNAVLHREFLQLAPWSAVLCIYLAAGALGAWTTWRTSTPWRTGLLIAIGALWFALQFPFFNRWGLLTPVVGPLVILGVMGLFGLIYDLVRAGAEQLRLHLTLEERARTQNLLENANTELEGRVAARTADLTSANERLISSLGEKDVLLKEVHHRVKNNLQVISSLLNLQSGHIKDPVALQIFIESRNRVRSMALIHEKLYQSEDLARIDFEDYIRTLSSGLLAGFAGKKSAIRIAVDVEKIMLPVDAAVPCGLIVNELVTNCFKYAFTSEAGGQIRISMKRGDDAQLHLSVSDDGVGFPKDVDFRNTESLGLQLVTTLSEQLEGTLNLKNGVGTTFEIAFPENYKSKL